MKRTGVMVLLLAGLFSVGCGSGEDASIDEAVSDAAASAATAGEEAVEAATTAGEEAVGAAAEAASAAAADDPIARCLELAAEMNWKDALEPCTEAAKEKPDDLGIKHALQQAQAAAEE